MNELHLSAVELDLLEEGLLEQLEERIEMGPCAIQGCGAQACGANGCGWN